MIAALLGLGAQSLAAPAPVVEVSSVTRSAASDINSRVERLESLLRANSQSQLRLEQVVDQMQREIGELRGYSEAQGFQIEQMLERQRQLYQELAKLQSAPAKSSSTEQQRSDRRSVESLSEADSYTVALNLATKERRFDDAIPAFRDFIAQYPSSSYTSNAYYWLGQLLYNKGELPEAAQMFAKVAGDYPESGKRADSILKQGLIADRQGDKAKAKQFFKSVIAQYSGSSAAQMAAKHLN
ncbi:tol-pal system protein YbgF [Ferrimonas pelagia]|uniref:Cell division coordinator CpoB n=1 Tax=Ferrimonas pelagia TaxID=1177826 RepID=A0ABP9E9U6_9GAMM